MIWVYNHLQNARYFRFHYHFQKVIGSLWVVGQTGTKTPNLIGYDWSTRDMKQNKYSVGLKLFLSVCCFKCYQKFWPGVWGCFFFASLEVENQTPCDSCSYSIMCSECWVTFQNSFFPTCQVRVVRLILPICGRCSLPDLNREAEDLPDRTPERMSEEMAERMSEDFLQSVCEVGSNRTHFNLCSYSYLQRCLRQATSYSK